MALPFESFRRWSPRPPSPRLVAANGPPDTPFNLKKALDKVAQLLEIIKKKTGPWSSYAGGGKGTEEKMDGSLAGRGTPLNPQKRTRDFS
jgi:hypothetical protein